MGVLSLRNINVYSLSIVKGTRIPLFLIKVVTNYSIKKVYMILEVIKDNLILKHIYEERRVSMSRVFIFFKNCNFSTLSLCL